MTRRVRLSAAEARRAALAAQGFGRSRPGSSADARHFRRVIETLGLLQLDFVNVLVPAHHLVMWSRLGGYDRQRFEKFLYGSRQFTEQWAHEASVVPVAAWPLLEHRRAAWQPSKNNPLLQLPRFEIYLRRALDQVRNDGALTANDLQQLDGPPRKPGDWHRSMPRRALEFHFARGDLAVSHRLPNFQRVYDLPERVIPPQHLARAVSKTDAQRALLKKASSAYGVATLRDLADYYRMSPRDAAPRVNELVESGDIVPVAVEGWSESTYLAADIRIPRSMNAAALLSPFDPVTWYRPRALRLFDFFYRLEIYVPAHKRQWGYYVLPFLLGDDIVARVDLKANRLSRTLVVRRAHAERCCDTAACIPALVTELVSLKRWLGLDTVAVRGSDRFSKTLQHAIRQRQAMVE